METVKMKQKVQEHRIPTNIMVNITWMIEITAGITCSDDKITHRNNMIAED